MNCLTCIALQSWRNTVIFLTTDLLFHQFSCYIFKSGAISFLFLDDRRNQRVLVTMKEFLQFISEQIKLFISKYICISFLSVKT